MLRTLFFLIILCGITTNLLSQNPSLNINKIYNWISPDTSVKGYNDCWGFEADGREYAVIGSNWGTHFLEITSTLSAPRVINEFEGKANNVIWRDFKSYSHYMYGVADGDSNSLQIFDLQYLPDSVVKIYDDNSISESSHNIFIHNDRLYFCANQINLNKSEQVLDVYSLQNPENPTHLASFSNSVFNGFSIHDVHVVDNIAYCSAGYGGLYIYDLNDLDNPVLLALIDVYPEQGYNHSSWLSDDKNLLVVADEVPSTLALKLFEVSDPENIELLDIFHSNDLATPHNPFFADEKIMVSYYLDGVQVFDYQNNLNVNRIAYYDTYPDDTNYFDFGAYSGCWGIYPFLSSKHIIASDRTYGLFVLKLDDIQTSDIEKYNDIGQLNVFPNPITQERKININIPNKIKNIWIYDNRGSLIFYDTNADEILQLDNKFLSKGKYIVIVEGVNKQIYKEKIIVE